jgi:hypothetical protein
MKVYVRRWNAERRQYSEEGPYEVGQYEGVCFVTKEANAEVFPAVRGRVRNIFLHAKQADALCVYVEDEREEVEE